MVAGTPLRHQLLLLPPSLHPPATRATHSAALPPPYHRPNSLTRRARLRPCSEQRRSPSRRKSNGRDDEPASPQARRPSPFAFSVPRLLDRFRVDDISLQILTIGLPAMLALAADPIASLVDTAFVGHLGSVELAAVGVSVSVFNLVSKLFNIPLLNVTTSFVAEQQALECRNFDEDETNEEVIRRKSLNSEIRFSDEGPTRKVLPAVSTSLVLAACFGIAEALALIFGSGLLMNLMGIPIDSPMRIPAEQFLTLRAYGAPPLVIALAAQGTFRGFKDTGTPLYAVCAGNLLNAILDPVLIFILDFGIGGAAIATVISEYLIACILLWKLNERVVLVSPNITGEGIGRYLKSAGLLVGRTIAVLLTMTLSTSLTAREGTITMAGQQICLQVWLAVSLLNDALALAGQALLATEYTKRNYKQARLIVFRVIQVGAATGIILAIFLLFGFESFSNLFTTDPAVLNIARSGLWFVTISQPINALAFVIDGLYYGVSDFAYAAYSMVFAGLISSVFLVMAAPVFGLAGVWSGLILFMILRAAAGLWRIQTRGGPWLLLWSDIEIGLVKK